MCYTKQASISAFAVGVISSLLLIFFGDPLYRNQNIAIGLSFIFTSFMQLVDYMIYIDPNCKNGWNEVAGKIGPILNVLQPLVIYIFILLFVENSSIKLLASSWNILYVIYVLNVYSQYFQKGNFCSFQLKGRPRWTWYNFFGTRWEIFYLLILYLNLLTLWKFKYFKVYTILITLFFLISYFNYKNHIGEFWCWFVNSVPLIILILQKLNF
jgi:hypothetical protein